jgi:hypothetical protein
MPQQVDFYTGDKEADTTSWLNAIYQAQQEYRFLDSCFTYDGSDLSLGDINITPLGTNTVTLTAGTGLTFQSGWVGRQIWGRYGSLGIGGGRYNLISYTDSTHMTAEVLSAADSATLTKGNWYLTTNSVTGLDHLEGQTVGVFASGQNHPDRTVSSGTISLDAQYAVVHAGLKYVGIFQTMDLELGGGRQGSKSSVGLAKRVLGYDIKFLDTLGASFGTNFYDQNLILYTDTTQRLGMPPRPFTGIQRIPISDGWNNGNDNDTEKNIVVMQQTPQPCFIEIININTEAGTDD